MVTNSVDCIKDEKPTTTLKVVKQWSLAASRRASRTRTPGALSVTVNDTSTNQTWNDVKGGLPVGAERCRVGDEAHVAHVRRLHVHPE